MNYEAIIYDVKNHIAYVTLNRPEVLNAVNQQMRREIIDVCEQARRDPEVRVCIFTGAGDRAFSTGFDLKERASHGEEPSLFAQRHARHQPGIHLHHQAISAMDKPTIAAIRGYAVGGGLEVALACDMTSGRRGCKAWHDGSPPRETRGLRRHSTVAASDRNCESA